MKKIENLLWGIVLIVIGTILAFNALGITDINIFFSGWWTLFIIIPCAIGLCNEENRLGKIIGLLIGIVLLLCSQGIFEFGVVLKLILPIILIVNGLIFIFKDSISKPDDTAKTIEKDNK